MTVAVMGLLTSCLKDQEDIFDMTSSERIEEGIADSYEILTSAEHGWLMKYYPSPYRTYGGYNVILKFTADGKVIVSSDIANSSTETAKSYYKVTQSAGVVLSFDTYNDIFHLFSTPDPVLGEPGEGWGGDYDFLFISATTDTIVLKGKKSGNYATLIPMESDDWSGYLDSVQLVEETMSFPRYTMNVGDVPVDITKSYRSFSMTYPIGQVDTTVTVPYVVSPAGIEFYEPLTINRQKISGFKYADDTFDFASADESSVVLNGIVPPINETFVGDLWATSLSNIGAFGTPYWEFIRDNVMPDLGETLQYFYFGKNGSYWGASFNSSGYVGVLGMQYQLVGDDQVKLVYYEKGNYGNGSWYVDNALFHFLLIPFGCGFDQETYEPVPTVRTFTLSCDNPKSPTWFILTDVDNPNNVIRLVNYPVDPFN